ncbi:dihydrofolate reductase family protein [Nocardia sp. GCM10030253]|uniref:dihydrofolate reductase family protein n=1 Tax=Nocardia sp. GCM10030253 TaxID=3273404 RepID=UPI00363D0C52
MADHPHRLAGLRPRLAETTWLGSCDADKIRRLEDESAGNIYVSGSGALVRALLADGLVDELHLFVHPVAPGSGARFWSSDASAVRLALKSDEVYDNDVVHLCYGPDSHTFERKP